MTPEEVMRFAKSLLMQMVVQRPEYDVQSIVTQNDSVTIEVETEGRQLSFTITDETA